tara:strand:- start:137 stop:463 length:327 start_codon:yes stop_codon:yes gene_type:complete
MSRFEESKLLEHDSRLAQISRDLEHLKEEKESPEKMVEIKVVPIEFTPEKYQIGEAEMNALIASGWLIQKEFSRESGVVFVMSRWEKKKDSRTKSNVYLTNKEEMSNR